jgi:predicted Zn-dependent protease
MALPQARAAAQTSLAALEQTRAELAVYQWPAWPVQDALRRSRSDLLDPVIAQYERALAVAPDAGAAMRLGQIELSLGRYQDARTHLAVAWAATPSRPAVQQLYGESLAVTGDVEGAALVWRHVSNEVDQLAIREGWYRLIGDGQREAWIRDARARAQAR